MGKRDLPAGVGLITGAASGIGRHLTGLLARHGFRLLATDANEQGLEQAAREEGWPADRVVPHPLDVRRPNAWEAALDTLEQHHGPVDLLLNVAGVLKPAWVADIADADVDLMIDVNVKGVIYGTRAAARRMVPRGQGHIVNFGSLASLGPVPGLGVYSTSKFAVRGFSLAAAVELRERGVAVSLVMPDAVQTPMLDLQVGYEEAALTFSGSRALTVEDIGEAVVQRVLTTRPIEIALPTGRGLLARLAGDFPEAARSLRPLLVRTGRRHQARASKRREPT
jgi:NAD(P)-dependent dehydrogenase (short-subunit alcohol dehydrogenase family)